MRLRDSERARHQGPEGGSEGVNKLTVFSTRPSRNQASLPLMFKTFGVGWHFIWPDQTSGPQSSPVCSSLLMSSSRIQQNRRHVCARRSRIVTMTKAGLVHERAASPSIQARSSEKASAHTFDASTIDSECSCWLAVMLLTHGLLYRYMQVHGHASAHAHMHKIGM